LELAGLHGTARSEGTSLDAVDATGTVVRGGAAHLTLVSAPGGRRVELSSDHAGDLLRALGIFDYGMGGQVRLTAPLEGDDGQAPPGLLEIEDFRVTKAPVLAHILSLGSLNGIGDVLRGEGITFTRAKVPFTRSGGTIHVNDARAVGAIGLT